jgi:1,2-dihydroxy-3-keto-5-methylthiopentene dioxygenase
MTHLTLYPDHAPDVAQATVAQFEAIADHLAAIGIGLERWDASAPIAADADDTAILEAFAEQIAALKARGHYSSVDIVRLTPASPDTDTIRSKFLAEHVHDDDEVRFFVEGAGMFYIRAHGTVHALECTAGDLIVLPKGTAHWFDTGTGPQFTAIRLFTSPDGWVARFTGDAIADRFPAYAGAG